MAPATWSTLMVTEPPAATLIGKCSQAPLVKSVESMAVRAPLPSSTVTFSRRAGRQPVASTAYRWRVPLYGAGEVEPDPGLGGVVPARRPALALVGTLEGADVAGELRPGVARALLDRVGHPGRQADEVGGPAVPAADDVAVGAVHPDPVALEVRPDIYRDVWLRD